jgi:hypothetical protein
MGLPLYKDENYVPPPHGMHLRADRLEGEISDLERCLKGDSGSERWQKLKVELTNKKKELLFMRRRFAGRNPMMKSWNDPLPK